MKILIRSKDFDLIDSKHDIGNPVIPINVIKHSKELTEPTNNYWATTKKFARSTPLSVFSRNTSLWLCLPIILFMFAFPNMIFAQQNRVDTEALADRIAGSVNELVGNYRTIAISRIKQRSRKRVINLEQLIDYTNVKIVRGERFHVTAVSYTHLTLPTKDSV